MDGEHGQDRRESDQRLARLEGIVSGLAGRFETFEHKLDEIGRNSSIEARTQWGPIMAGLAVVVALVGVLGSGYSKDQTRLENTVGKLTDIFNAHDDGHPKWVNEKLESGRESRAALDRRVDTLSASVARHHEEDAQQFAASEARVDILWRKLINEQTSQDRM